MDNWDPEVPYEVMTRSGKRKFPFENEFKKLRSTGKLLVSWANEGDVFKPVVTCHCGHEMDLLFEADWGSMTCWCPCCGSLFQADEMTFEAYKDKKNWQKPTGGILQ